MWSVDGNQFVGDSLARHSAPPSFVQCDTCSRLFGSRSIALHRRQCCPEQTSTDNASASRGLPSAEPRSYSRRRTLAPQRRGSRPLTVVEERRRPANRKSRQSSRGRTAVTTTTTNHTRASVVMSKRNAANSRKCRPRTATLKKSAVLASTPFCNMDMSLTRCKELLELISLNSREHSTQSQEEDSVSTNDSEVASKRSSARTAYNRTSNTVERPKTIVLKQSRHDLHVPVIESPLTNSTHKNTNGEEEVNQVLSTGNHQKRLPNFTRALEQLLQSTARARLNSPPPLCSSCNDSSKNPERLHSHPNTVKSVLVKRARPHKKRLSASRPVVTRCKTIAAAHRIQHLDDGPAESEDIPAADNVGDELTTSTLTAVPDVSFDPTSADSVIARKQKLDHEQRQRQRRLQDEYRKKEERSRKARQEALRKKLAFAVAKCARSANQATVETASCTECTHTQRITTCADEMSHRVLDLHRQTHCPPSSLPANDQVTNSNTNISSAAKQASEVVPHPLCYICKSRFPPTELEDHEKSCLALWHVRNQPLKEDEQSEPPVSKLAAREAVPSAPDLPVSAAVKGATLNAQENCDLATKGKRKVKPKAVKTLPKSTKADVQDKKHGHMDGTTSGQLAKQLNILIECTWEKHKHELVPCPKCGRTFFPDRLPKHKSVCKVSSNNKKKR